MQYLEIVIYSLLDPLAVIAYELYRTSQYKRVRIFMDW